MPEVLAPATVRSFTTSEVAAMHGVTSTTVRYWVKQGRLAPLPWTADGGWKRFAEDEVKRFRNSFNEASAA